MKFEWNTAKAKLNHSKHGVKFAELEAVFLDPLALTIEDASAQGEDRYITIGSDMYGNVLTVVYTYRDEDTIRLISARPATKREKTEYES